VIEIRKSSPIVAEAVEAAAQLLAVHRLRGGLVLPGRRAGRARAAAEHADGADGDDLGDL